MNNDNINNIQSPIDLRAMISSKTTPEMGNGSESSFRKTLAAFLQIELVSRQVFSVKVYEFYKSILNGYDRQKYESVGCEGLFMKNPKSEGSEGLWSCFQFF